MLNVSPVVQIEADLTPEGADATVAAPALDRLFRDPHREVQGYLRPYVKACLFQPTSRQRLGTLLCVAETHRQWLNKMQEVAGKSCSSGWMPQSSTCLQFCFSSFAYGHALLLVGAYIVSLCVARNPVV